LRLALSACIVLFVGETEVANGKGSTMELEYINADDVVFTPRGRKSNTSPELVDALRKMPKGKAARIPSLRVNPTDADAKTAKARVGATLRAAAKMAGVKIGILWSPDGVPQVVKK
jgi:hypothetical protein